ncbi:MAG: helix-turn-helix transcriptional regulator [Proteobacteria bacterium]|nr:helix-turn-helix transcriptional regulator [Pseudomonadota bacterium]
MTTKKRPTLKFTTGEAIKAARLKRNENQAEFWGRLGVTQSGGSRYESGRNIPRPVQLLLQVTYGTDKQVEDLLVWLRGVTQPKNTAS